ncbi:MAG: iron-containing alcohol dehydrogenase [Candidatus Omnitrophica bacterium]|nr:iron-containing alcohol dehydrogenase [Candidatus Omnitrophota bacterium]
MEIDPIIGKDFLCAECGQRHTVGIKYIEEGNINKFCRFFKKVFNKDKKKVLLLADNITWEIAGEKCKNSIEKEYCVLPVILFPEGERKVTAKQEYLAKIVKEASKADVILTVGAGTITDLGKITGNIKNKPVVCFPTAPSMNGYTSPVAAYIKDGLKLTIPVTPAYGVFFDMDILKNAPMELIKSGFADSMAKAYANADWKISSMITGESFCPLPYKIVSRSNRRRQSYPDGGELLLKRDTQTISELMQTLNLGGISMIIAGKSSPASGGEHLISHFLDMYAHQHREEVFAYHGLQVGTGIFISSLVYEEMKRLTVSEIERLLSEVKIDYDKHFQTVISFFPAGADMLKKEFDEKMRQIAVLRESLATNWEDVQKNAFTMVYTPERIAGIFKKSEIPLHLREIAVDEKIIYDVIMLARFIRGRLTILDIAGETGILETVAQKYKELSS